MYVAWSYGSLPILFKLWPGVISGTAPGLLSFHRVILGNTRVHLVY
jgi:hypothetical protein